jgi:8-oxo-dGTP diphosphatase
VRAEEAERALDGDNVRWFPADELPELAFDHNLIVEYALWRLRTKMEYSRIAHAFLGETFTLTALREVHEAVLQKALDPANFRRQLESSSTLVPTDAVVQGGRHRPPRLYRYDERSERVDNGPLGAPSFSPRTSKPLNSNNQE